MTAPHCPDAVRIAAKIRAIEEKHRQRPAMARYSLFIVSPKGYTHLGAFDAPSVRDACRQHIKAWHSRATSFAVVMRAPDGKRYSYQDSVQEVAHG